MKIFITGATGYVGNQLARQLLQQGEELSLLVRDPQSVNLPAGKNVSIFKGDITDEESITRAIRGCTHVYHCAAIAKFGSSAREKFYSVNVTGTKNILDAAVQARVQKIVFTSSAAVFGPSLNIPLTENDPRIESFESDYDFSKHLAENKVREFISRGLNAVIVNPSRVYGPGPATYSNAVTRMIQYLLTKKILFFPKIDEYRTNYCYINDVVNGHILAMEKGVAGENYILGGENISYAELLNTVTNQAAVKTRVVRMPVGFVKKIALLSQLMNRNTELTPSLITRFAKNRMLDSKKAMNCLGYKVTSFNEGIQHTIDFLKPGKQ